MKIVVFDSKRETYAISVKDDYAQQGWVRLLLYDYDYNYDYALYIFNDYEYDYDYALYILNDYDYALYIFNDYEYDYVLYYLIMITIVHKDSLILREFNNHICLLLHLINISFSKKLSTNLHKNSNIFLALLETKRI